MSAFCKPPERSQRGQVCHPPTEFHMVAKASAGLAQLFKEIRNSTVPCLPEYGYYTDHNGCFDINDGQCILALRYRFVDILGTGQSAVVIKALDLFNNNKPVAVKILHTQYYHLGAQETDCCVRLRAADPLCISYVCRLLNTFSFDDHYCMVFELHPQPNWIEQFHPLDKPVNIEEIYTKLQKSALRLIQVLAFLKQQNVIHADLKPENLLLKSKDDISSLHVSDFGNAIHCVYDEVSLYYDDFNLQTLLYRAPEVMFGLQFSQEIDMWSVGCILSEFFLGKPLFYGTTKREVLQKMVQLLGPIPRSLVQRGKFYSSLDMYTFTGSQPDATQRLLLHLETGRIKKCTNYALASFLAQILRYDPAERLTLREAACHPFLAREVGWGYVFPASTPNNACLDENCGYPSILVSKKNYQHKPYVAKDILRHHPSSKDLLTTGTSLTASHQTDENKRRVAEVFPLGFQPSELTGRKIQESNLSLGDNLSTGKHTQNSARETSSLSIESQDTNNPGNNDLRKRQKDINTIERKSFISVEGKSEKFQDTSHSSRKHQESSFITSSDSVQKSRIKKKKKRTVNVPSTILLEPPSKVSPRTEVRLHSRESSPKSESSSSKLKPFTAPQSIDPENSASRLGHSNHSEKHVQIMKHSRTLAESAHSLVKSLKDSPITDIGISWRDGWPTKRKCLSSDQHIKEKHHNLKRQKKSEINHTTRRDSDNLNANDALKTKHRPISDKLNLSGKLKKERTSSGTVLKDKGKSKTVNRNSVKKQRSVKHTVHKFDQHCLDESGISDKRTLKRNSISRCERPKEDGIPASKAQRVKRVKSSEQCRKKSSVSKHFLPFEEQQRRSKSLKVKGHAETRTEPAFANLKKDATVSSSPVSDTYDEELVLLEL